MTDVVSKTSSVSHPLSRTFAYEPERDVRWWFFSPRHAAHGTPCMQRRDSTRFGILILAAYSVKREIGFPKFAAGRSCCAKIGQLSNDYSISVNKPKQDLRECVVLSRRPPLIIANWRGKATIKDLSRWIARAFNIDFISIAVILPSFN